MLLDSKITYVLTLTPQEFNLIGKALRGVDTSRDGKINYENDFLKLNEKLTSLKLASLKSRIHEINKLEQNLEIES